MADNTMLMDLMDAYLTECEIRKKVLLSILSLVMPCASSVFLPSMDLSANMHLNPIRFIFVRFPALWT